MGLLNILFGGRGDNSDVSRLPVGAYDPRGTPIFSNDGLPPFIPYETQSSQGPLDLPGIIHSIDNSGSSDGAAPERKGMFGIHGTFRNILGAIADGLSLQGGGKAMFREGEDARDIGDLLSRGDINDPQTFAKIVSINPAIAEKIAATQGNLAYRQAMLGARVDHWRAQDDLGADKLTPKWLDIAGSMIRSANADNFDAIKDTATKFLTSKGIDPSLAALPDAFDEKSTPYFKIDPVRVGNMRETVDWHKETLPIMQQNANSGTTKANAAAALVPSTIQRNQSQADYNDAGADYRRGQRDGTNAPPALPVERPDVPRPSAPAPVAAPPAGYVNKNGMKYTGRGDWRDARNWVKVK